MGKRLGRLLFVFSVGALALAGTTVACMNQDDQERPAPDGIPQQEFATERLFSNRDRPRTTGSPPWPPTTPATSISP